MPNLYQPLVEEIAENCINLYKNLPKTGKPVDKEWTVLSCIVQYQTDTKIHEVVSLGTGSKCIGATKMSSQEINDPKSIQFHLDKVTIDNLMTTMSRQMELAKFLATCEASGRLTEKVVNDVIPAQGNRVEGDLRPLTLFGSNTDKIRIVALVLASGPTVESGFDLAFKIVSEHKLDSMNIYIHVAKYLVNADRFMEVKTLAKCIRASSETAASLMSDQVLEAGTAAVVARCEARGQLHDEQAELLISDISSHAIKISCYLVCRNVSSAYILAARHERTNDLRRVLHEAERLGNEQVRNACLKRLTSKNVLA